MAWNTGYYTLAINHGALPLKLMMYYMYVMMYYFMLGKHNIIKKKDHPLNLLLGKYKLKTQNTTTNLSRIALIKATDNTK